MKFLYLERVQSEILTSNLGFDSFLLQAVGVDEES